MRDYQAIVKRVEAVQNGMVTVRELGQVNGFPVLCASVGRGASLPTIYVNGGTHGDEPGGVEGVLAFLEGDWGADLDRVRFEVIPCLNPWGYVHDSRENAQGVDINWAIKRDDVPEIAIVKRFIEGLRFAAVVDLHEDWESPGYYVYELFRNRPVGPQIAGRVARVCPLNTNREIEGEQAVGGVIHPNMELEKRRKGEGIPICLFQNRYTDHLITAETPTKEPMANRVNAHLATLAVMVETYGQNGCADVPQRR